MKKHVVLVVEDDVDIRETLVEILEHDGYGAASAPNGQAALEMLVTGAVQPDVIVLDLMMPVMDGATFREKQRADPTLGHIPVIIVSASNDVEERAQELGVAFLRKPIKLGDLRALLRSLCGG